MKRVALNNWLILGALGASFLSGCNHTAQRPQLLPPVSSRSGGGQRWANNGCGQCGPYAQTAQPPQADTAYCPTCPPATPADTATAPGGETLPQTTLPLDPPQVADVKGPFPRGEPGISRKSYVDLTASPCYGHAPDYNWIIGQVEYSNIAKGWRLRYTSVDESDRYGGRVVLIENHHVSLLRDGQFVHVRGHIVDGATSGDAPPHYRIEWFRVIDNPNQEQSPNVGE